jgi:hypothetical protein
MNIRPLALPVVVCVIATGCAPKPAPPTVAAPPPVVQKPAPPTSPLPAAPVDSHTAEEAAKSAIEKGIHSEKYKVDFPQDTHVNSVTVDHGVAKIDFSAAFNKLADMGDTTESNAQKALRHMLADVPGIDKMAVSVEGKPFDSQTTDWSTPFEVKLEGVDGPDSTLPNINKKTQQPQDIR